MESLPHSLRSLGHQSEKTGGGVLELMMEELILRELNYLCSWAVLGKMLKLSHTPYIHFNGHATALHHRVVARVKRDDP